MLSRFVQSASGCKVLSRRRWRRALSGYPLVGVGLFFGQGYFRQRLDRDGWQHEEYLETNVNQLPMEAAIGKNGRPVMVQVKTRHGSIAPRYGGFESAGATAPA